MVCTVLSTKIRILNFYVLNSVFIPKLETVWQCARLQKFVKQKIINLCEIPYGTNQNDTKSGSF